MKWTFLVLCCIAQVAWAQSWLIVANGPEIGFEDLQNHISKDSNVLVLDGAANRFKKLSRSPDVILGDFDSIEDPKYWGIHETFLEIDNDSGPYDGNFGVRIVPAKDQDHTDLEKGILYADARDADSIVILQATEGRLDHTLGNLGTLRKYHRKDRSLIIETQTEKVCYLSNQRIVIEKGQNGYCGIMGYPEGKMTTEGLAYNGAGYALYLGLQESSCNWIVDSKAEIAIEGEALVIFPKTAEFTIRAL